VLSADPPEGVFAILKPLRLQAELYSELLSEIVALVDKYAYHSEHPGNRDVPDRELWNLAIAAAPGAPDNLAPLKTL